MYGQELNPETWAIARSDLMIKGADPDRMVLGNSLTEDGWSGQRFDYMLANPPRNRLRYLRSSVRVRPDEFHAVRIWPEYRVDL